ncbi:MAG: hypothetical protein HY057_10960, partial [Rhodospirillales bacterium]|nr:hypothetical protein [Rhodospirillales bacterium]
MNRPRNPIVVIPARLQAIRLPGKPLADIHGEPMIVHVWRRARARSSGVSTPSGTVSTRATSMRIP